jgi:hypothetical protein
MLATAWSHADEAIVPRAVKKKKAKKCKGRRRRKKTEKKKRAHLIVLLPFSSSLPQCPAEVGGFVLELPFHHKVFANCAGMYLEIDTAAEGK